MKVARLYAAHDLRLAEEPVPQPGPGEVLLRVSAVGLCGSDVHWWSTGGIGDARLERPLVLGHEFAGVIESGAQRGQRVAVDPAVPCGECEFCREGSPNLCTALRFAGHGREDGALRQYIAWPARCLYPLPDTLGDEDGAVLEPLGVAIYAVDLGHLQPGMTVGVYGCGPIGLLLLQVVRVAGATGLIATDRLAHRLEAARSLGALALPADGQESAAILDATRGRGVDVAFEVAGENQAVETAVTTVRPGGRVVLVGIPDDDRTSFTASTARRKGLTIQLVRRMKHTYPRAIRLVESGHVDLRPLVTHRFSLDAAAQAFSCAQQRVGIKVIVCP
jgi:L-iditol 2-dehydrogenase